MITFVIIKILSDKSYWSSSSKFSVSPPQIRLVDRYWYLLWRSRFIGNLRMKVFPYLWIPVNRCLFTRPPLVTRRGVYHSQLSTSSITRYRWWIRKHGFWEHPYWTSPHRHCLNRVSRSSCIPWSCSGIMLVKRTGMRPEFFLVVMFSKIIH